jgi:hypothetical protein
MEHEQTREDFQRDGGGGSPSDDAAMDATAARMRNYLDAAGRVLDGMNVEQMEEMLHQHAQRGAQ